MDRLVLLQSNGATGASERALLSRLRQEIRACDSKIELYDNEFVEKSQVSKPPTPPVQAVAPRATPSITPAQSEITAPTKPPQLRKPTEAASAPALTPKVGAGRAVTPTKPVAQEAHAQAPPQPPAPPRKPPQQQQQQQQQQQLQQLQPQQLLLDLQRQHMEHFQQLHSQLPAQDHRRTPDFPDSPSVGQDLPSPLSAAAPAGGGSGSFAALRGGVGTGAPA